MFDGPEEEITLRCRNELIDQVIDRFGTGISIHPVDEESFEITETVAISGTFFGWLFQYVGEMMIVSPPNVRNEYMRMAQTVMQEAQSDE